MHTLTISTKSNAEFTHIDHVEPLTESDKPLVDEIYQALKKYNALNRFGLTLLHSHFDIEDDEVLLENTDETKRIQVIKPVKVSDIENLEAIETSWRLDTGTAVMSCKCLTDPREGRHGGHFDTGK